MTNLFCTPEQGARLKELVPELKYALVWGIDRGEFKPMMKDKMSNQFVYAQPALTLQELRDLYEASELGHRAEFYSALSSETAPELADWVIERLEAQ